jgi:uncharacterized protein (DUF58 family)
VARLQNFTLIARTVVEGFISGLHRSPFQGFSVEFSEHREYSPGDDLRYLDWRALGRSDRYFIKRFEEETNLKAHLLLDASASMGYGSGRVSKLEYACYLAASLAYLMIRQQDSVGLVVFDEKVREFLPPRSSTLHLNLLLRTLEKVSAGGITNVSETFHRLAENIKRRGLIVIVSDLFDEPRAVMRGLRHFRHKKHEVIIFHVLDRAEIDFPFQRLANFIDLETRQRLQVDPRYLRDDYRRQIEDFIADYKRDCSESLVEYVPTHTSVPFDFLLASYLTKRKKLH